MFFYNEQDSGGEVLQEVTAPSDPYFYNTSLLLKMDSDFSDSSTFNHTVTTNGNTTISSTESKYGGASGYFDGSGDYLAINDLSAFDFGANEFTVECWINRTGYGPNTQWGDAVIMTTADPSDGRGFGIMDRGGNFAIVLSTETSSAWQQNVNTGVAVPQNEWAHVALVRVADSIVLYLNGVNVWSNTISGALSNTDGGLRIGGRALWNQFFTGYIDDVRITKGVARYTANFTPPDSHPTTGPGIVTDSLTLNLDIGDDTSYAGTGTTVNNIAGSDTATLTGNILFSSDNEGYLDFDGADDTMGVANGSSVDITDTITVEAWVNPDAVAGWLTLISKNNVQQPEGYHFGFDPSGNMMGGVRNSGNWITTQTATPVNIGQWQHLVMSMDTNTNIQKFYKNGALVYTNSNFTANLNSNTNPLSVSGQPITGVEKYNGKLAKAALYSRALTDEEVTQNFNALKSRFGL